MKFNQQNWVPQNIWWMNFEEGSRVIWWEKLVSLEHVSFNARVFQKLIETCYSLGCKYVVKTKFKIMILIGGKDGVYFGWLLNAADLTFGEKVNSSIWSEIRTRLRISKHGISRYFSFFFQLERSNKRGGVNTVGV